MEKPDLEKMWETFIKIGLPPIPHKLIQELIRFKIYPMISRLKNEGVINWYCFLIHNKDTGVPTTKDDDNLYFHIRFSLKEDINPNDVLPDYCDMTQKKPKKRIYYINKSLLKNEEIEEAWRIIGEQSEWIMNMLNIHKEDVEIPIQQILQFMHYFSNMLFLRRFLF